MRFQKNAMAEEFAYKKPRQKTKSKETFCFFGRFSELRDGNGRVKSTRSVAMLSVACAKPYVLWLWQVPYLIDLSQNKLTGKQLNIQLSTVQRPASTTKTIAPQQIRRIG